MTPLWHSEGFPSVYHCLIFFANSFIIEHLRNGFIKGIQSIFQSLIPSLPMVFRLVGSEKTCGALVPVSDMTCLCGSYACLEDVVHES